MALLRLSPLLLSFAFLGCPIAVAAQPEVQHLTCTKDPQGLMCKVEETQERILLKNPSQAQQSNLSSEQLSHLSTLLIGLMFLGLPITIVLSILIQDKRDNTKTKQIEQLERIWQRS